MPTNAATIALSFMGRINARDVEGLISMMTEDHTFTDSLGQSIKGRKWLQPAWEAYFEFCPDYWVTHDQVMVSGAIVAIFGHAGGTVAGIKWKTPAAWKAVIRDGQVQEWRVYADNKPVYDILGKQEPQG